jgi:hypothetical protein
MEASALFVALPGSEDEERMERVEDKTKGRKE